MTPTLAVTGWALAALVYLAFGVGIACGVFLIIGFWRDRTAELRQAVRAELKTLAATEKLAEAAWHARQQLAAVARDARRRL